MRIRVLLAHSSPLMRAGILSALRTSVRVEVVAEASRGEEVLPAIEAASPQVVLMDGELHGAFGPLEVVRQMRSAGSAPAVLVLSGAAHPGLICGALGAGAAGLLCARASPDAILKAVVAAAQGQQLWTPAQLDELARWQREVGCKLDALTPREWEVLTLIAAGLTNRHIADRLVVAPGTVAVHVRRVLGKLGARNRVEAAAFLLEHGSWRAGRAEKPRLQTDTAAP